MKWLKEFFRGVWLFLRSHEQEYTPIVKPEAPSVDQALGNVKPKLKNTKWYDKALSFFGMTEHDSKFNKYLSSFWKIVGLPNYKTIVGTSFAWCGLFVATMFSETGHKWISNGAGARNWDKFGTKVEYVKKGIPHTAVVRLNHGFDCSSSKGNHVGFVCGNYKPSDFIVNGKLKPGAKITLLGGNQGDTVKYSTYDMREVCSVTWPSDAEAPPEVTETIPCDKASSKDSTTR